jgi:nucleoside diphosphate kinase
MLHYIIDFFRFIREYFYSLNKSIVFTKGENFLNAIELKESLEKAGCKVLTSLCFFMRPEEVCAHYPHIVGESFFPETQKTFHDYPIYFMEVRGNCNTIIKVIGTETNADECAEGTFRKKHGHGYENAAHRTGKRRERPAEWRRFLGKNGIVTKYRKDIQRQSEDHIRMAEVLLKMGKVQQ